MVTSSWIQANSTHILKCNFRHSKMHSKMHFRTLNSAFCILKCNFMWNDNNSYSNVSRKKRKRKKEVSLCKWPWHWYSESWWAILSNCLRHHQTLYSECIFHHTYGDYKDFHLRRKNLLSSVTKTRLLLNLLE